MDLSLYKGDQGVKDQVIKNIEEGTLVEKDKKKKKKNKNKKEQKNKDIDEDKIKQQAKLSELHNVKELTQEEKMLFSEAENHPLKLICTNLPFKITSQELITYFNTVIAASNPQLAQPPPISDVDFDKTRTFAIMTLSSRKLKDFFRTHPQFTYIEGSTIFKIQRPKNFFAEKYLNKQGDLLKNAGSEGKIYLGGLPLAFVDHQVRKICETFGKLKFFNLVKDGNISKGYCFFEYEDTNTSQKAIKALNGLPIADKRLKCHAATLGNKGLSLAFTPSNAANTGLTEIQVKPANHISGSYLLSYQNIDNEDIQQTIRSDPLCKVPSRVLQFLNMFHVQDLFDQQTYEDLQYDIKTQCEKYGQVQSITIPRPDPKCGYSVPSVGKALVKFMYIIHAKRARLHISGRVYNKRTVVVSFYPEQKYNSKEYLVTL